MSKRNKIICIVILLAMTMCAINVYVDDSHYLRGIYKGLCNPPTHGLPQYIVNNRNCVKIEDPFLCNDGGEEWFIHSGKLRYPISSYIYNTYFEESHQVDSVIYYKLKSDEQLDLLVHEFISVDICVLPMAPQIIFDEYWYCSGLYRGKLSAPYSHNINTRMFPDLLAWSILTTIRTFLESKLTKPQTNILDEYVTNSRIYYKKPLLYLPFPLSNHGYLFSSDVLEDFDKRTSFIPDQNYYSVLTDIPSDIRKIGSVVSYDENGLLLSLNMRKTPTLRVELHRLNNNYYAAKVNYKATKRRIQIDENEYRSILEYSNRSTSLYEIYDKQIFINMKSLLSELSYENPQKAHEWK